MAVKLLIFDFYNLSHKEKAVAKAMREFARAGAQVASVDVAANTKTAHGVEYREVQFGFADSQSVLFGVTATGDVAQVKLNGKVIAIKNQDDHGKAIAEIVGLLAKGRAKFQAALAKRKVALPPSIRTAAPKLEQTLSDHLSEIREAIERARARLAVLRAHVAAS